MTYHSPAALSFTLLTACGGATWGESTAGGDGFLSGSGPADETGAAANDDWCAWIGSFQASLEPERTWVELQQRAADCADDDPSASTVHTLVGLQPDGDVLRKPIPALDDPRLLFGDDEIVLIGEIDGHEQLLRMSVDTLTTTDTATVEARWWGTRTAPSRRFVAVGDNSAGEHLPLELIDLSTLGTTAIDPGGAWAEAMWLNERDHLAAVIADAAVELEDGTLATEGTSPRVVLWDFEDHPGIPAGGTSPTVPTPLWEVRIPDTTVSLLISYTWIGVDPFDRYVSFPLLNADGSGAVLAILETADGALRTVQGVSGPVQFTPDGSSLVGWTSHEDGGSSLIVVDVDTLEQRSIPLPSVALPTYFLSHEGDEIIVASTFGEQELTLVDAATGDTTRLGVPLGLWSFSSRVGHDEVWMTGTPPEGEADQLWRLDLAAATLDPVDLPWSPGQVVWLPGSDLLALDDHARARVVLWDPDTRGITQDVDLSAPRSAR